MEKLDPFVLQATFSLRFLEKKYPTITVVFLFFRFFQTFKVNENLQKFYARKPKRLVL